MRRHPLPPSQRAREQGLDAGQPSQRSDRFEAACQVLIALLSQPVTNFPGEHYQLTDAHNEPKGPQRPHPAICIGGSGAKRTLRTAAKYAQHWNFVAGTPDQFARKRDVLHARCAHVGRDPSQITLSTTSRTTWTPGRPPPPGAGHHLSAATAVPRGARAACPRAEPAALTDGIGGRASVFRVGRVPEERA